MTGERRCECMHTGGVGVESETHIGGHEKPTNPGLLYDVTLEQCPACARFWVHQRGEDPAFSRAWENQTAMVTPALAQALKEAASNDRRGVELAALMAPMRFQFRKGKAADVPDWERPNELPQFAFSQDASNRALAIAARAHGEQRTLKGLPYVSHVTAVSLEVMAAVAADSLGVDEADVAIQCALLHDVLEDTGWCAADLRREGVSEPVISGVKALTRDAALPEDAQIADSVERLKEQPRAVQLVELADRISNLEWAPQHWDYDKISQYALDTELNILPALGKASPSLSHRLRSRLAVCRLNHLNG